MNNISYAKAILAKIIAHNDRAPTILEWAILKCNHTGELNKVDQPEKKQEEPPKKEIRELNQTFQSPENIEKPIFLVTIPPAMYLRHLYN